MAPVHPDILFIVLDAARAENLSVYGYERPTTPNLERLADGLAVYESCISTATWTLPSTASLFTGTYPSTHRLVVDGDRLPAETASLPELLAREGYRTAKVMGEVPYVSEFSGLDRGFAEEFEAPAPAWRRALSALRPSAPAAPEGAGEGFERIDHDLDLEAEARMHRQRRLRARLAWWMSGWHDDGAASCFDRVRAIWAEEDERPRFVYAHVMETHGEYRPPHRFRKRFVPRELRGRNFAAINQRPNPHAVGLVDMSEEDFAILHGLYDGCIAYMDELLGSLLDDLARSPRWDETLVVITADHGDCVGRHGVLGHQFVCYDELLRIPWIVKWPSSVGITGSREELIQNADLLPTLCGLLGIERPAQCETIDFLAEAREFAYAELLKPFGVTAVKQKLHERAPHLDRAVLAVRSASHKRIVYTNDQADELFDLRLDPREARNVLADPPSSDAEHLADLERAVGAWRPRFEAAAREVARRIHSGEEAAMSADVEAKLRALGYLD
ncbi:MAG: sulfatase-like hydrolase/transferase [Planctomycetota bacterium]|jgi:arylsulfatase A-like enzyme|nr:sulfatase-like hydrolase/transferase [Planctomycetota bacterium]MDP6761967.1 sulfatase-like hydrolase/transferase [Planctomycetota bacterium]MDP6989308.1 sulfatase-like hydrolase/transferase [Planctomycetota bacterium]